jgi:DNA polymerase-3 subunit alpha
MESASGYSFNKSHAFSYAVLAYQTAYFKANYPIEFMTALLTYKKDDQDVIKEYVNDCKKYDIKVIPPHINYSNIDFDITPRGEISFGLSALKGVGYGPAIEIVDSRETNGQYKDINDFLSRIKINSRVYEILASSGALDNLGWTRKALIEDKEKVVNFIKNINKKVDVGLQVGFDFFDEIEKATIETYIKEEYKPDYLLNMEYETLGMYLTGHPIQYYNISRRLKMKGISPKILKNISQLPSLKDKDEVYVFGVVQSIRRWESKKGWMAFVTLADFGIGEEAYEGNSPRFYTFDVVLFTDAYSNWGYKMRDNDFLGIKGKMNLRKDTGQLSMIAEEITFPIKDTDIEYENDPLMRKIVMDVLEDMRKEKEGLLPHNIEKQKIIEEDKSKEANRENQEKRKLKAVVTEDNYQDLVSLVESNPGDIIVYAVLNGDLKEIGGMRFNKKTHMALDFAGIEIFPI